MSSLYLATSSSTPALVVYQLYRGLARIRSNLHKSTITTALQCSV